MPQQIAAFPERILYPKKIKSILLLILCIAFVVIGVLMINDGQKVGWFVAITFLLGVVTFVINLVPKSSYLKLDESGFEICSLFRTHKYNWSDIAFFTVGRISHNKMVMFNFSATYERQKRARKIATAISGTEGALHDTFGLKAQELADLMNSYRDTYAAPESLGKVQ